jgi:hypothetical protein
MARLAVGPKSMFSGGVFPRGLRRPRREVECQYSSSAKVKITGGVPVLPLEALCYKQEGRGFDSRLCHWNFLLA